MPELTSLYHNSLAGEYGDRGYPGNCGGNLISDLLRFFRPATVFDPMTGSGTCRDVCKELGIYCWSSDLHQGFDACGRRSSTMRSPSAGCTRPTGGRSLHRRPAGPVHAPRRCKRSWNDTSCF